MTTSLFDPGVDVSGDEQEINDLLSAPDPEPARGRARGRKLRTVPPEPAVLDEDEQPDFEDDPGPRKRRGRPPSKVSTAVKRDIKAKTALFLTMPGAMVRMRDPICGTAIMDAIPGVSDALAEVFCESPAIVAWFQSSSGYMKYLRVLTELQPVLAIMAQHHLFHTIGDDGAQQGPADWSGYGVDGVA